MASVTIPYTDPATGRQLTYTLDDPPVMGEYRREVRDHVARVRAMDDTDARLFAHRLTPADVVRDVVYGRAMDAMLNFSPVEWATVPAAVRQEYEDALLALSVALDIAIVRAIETWRRDGYHRVRTRREPG